MPTADRIENKKLVIDASVALKWFAQETGTPEARVILQKIFWGLIEVSVPNLFVYEVTNSLWKSKKFNTDDISDAVETIYNSPIELFALDKLLALAAVRFMSDYNLTFYDASYVALAQILQAPLLTADLKHHKKIKEIEVLEL